MKSILINSKVIKMYRDDTEELSDHCDVCKRKDVRRNIIADRVYCDICLGLLVIYPKRDYLSIEVLDEMRKLNNADLSKVLKGIVDNLMYAELFNNDSDSD